MVSIKCFLKKREPFSFAIKITCTADITQKGEAFFECFALLFLAFFLILANRGVR